MKARVFRGVLVATVMLLLAVGSNSFPLHQANAALTWTTHITEQFRGNNILSSALQATNGTIWVAWQSDRYGPQNVFYKTLTAGTWSLPANFTTDGGNATPGLAQFQNGTIIMFWAGNQTGHFNLYYKTFNDAGGMRVWSDVVRLTNAPNDDTLPSATVARDGTLWLTWTRQIGVLNQIFYKTLANNSWSTEVQFTNDSNLNIGSSVSVGRDGVVRVVWAKGAPSGNPQIYYRTLNGTAWSADSQIVSSAYRDYHPTIVQSRDGSFWVFWTRVIPSGSVFTYKIFGKYSTDNGVTWPASTEVQLTFDCCSRISVDEFPAAIQSTTDNSLYVFYSTNTANLGEFDIYDLQSSAITGVHHVAVVSIRPSSSWTYAGGFPAANIGPLVTLYVTVADPGDYLETVTISASVSNSTLYALKSRTGTIVPGGSIMISFTWNTTGVKWARYTLSASVTPAPNTSSGNMGDSSLRIPYRLMVLPLGDVDQDGSVTITDVSLFFYDYGFTSTCGCARWNPFADINNNGIIDIVDVGVVLANYNTYI